MTEARVTIPTNEEQAMSPTETTEAEATSSPAADQVGLGELAERCQDLADLLAEGAGCDEAELLAVLPMPDAFYDLAEAARSPHVRNIHPNAGRLANQGFIDEARLRASWAREVATRLLPGAPRRGGDDVQVVRSRAAEARGLMVEAGASFRRAADALALHRAPPPPRCPTCHQVMP
jgi:hypothetical protein